MTKDNVKMLDCDEHTREERVKLLPEGMVQFCQRYNLVVDIASSDVCIYIKDVWGGEVCIA